MKKVLPKVRKIINMSIKQTKIYDDYELKIDYIILSIINDYNNSAIRILLNMDIDIDKLYKEIENNILSNKSKVNIDFNEEEPDIEYVTKDILKNAEIECDDLNEDYLDVHHILLSTLKNKNDINKIFKKMKVNYKNYKKNTEKFILENSTDDSEDYEERESGKRTKKSSKSSSKSSTPILDNFSIDVTQIVLCILYLQLKKLSPMTLFFYLIVF